MTEAASILPLHAWLSPSFPVGTFAYSQGLEWAVEDGAVGDAASLASWLDDLIAHGAVRADTVLLAAAYRAATLEAALSLNEVALALTPSRERHLETSTQGAAFLLAVAAAWDAPAIERFAAALDGTEVAYPVAVGIAAAAHALPLVVTLEAFALAAVSALVSAALRLGPVGQSQAQAIIARACPALAVLAREAAVAAPDDIGPALGTACWRADIASMRHETQYSRLFRS